MPYRFQRSGTAIARPLPALEVLGGMMLPQFPLGRFTVPPRGTRRVIGDRGYGYLGGIIPTGGGTTSGAGQAVQATGTVLMALTPIPVVGWVAGIVGALMTVAGSFMRKGPSHEVRAALETQRIGGAAQAFVNELHIARSIPDLYRTIVQWQSGYVGGLQGAGRVAISVRALIDMSEWPKWHDAGWILYPKGQTLEQIKAGHSYDGVGPGTENAYYPVLTLAGFTQAIKETRPFLSGVQAGIADASKLPINDAVNVEIYNKVNQFTGAAQQAMTDPNTIAAWVTQAYQQLLGRNPSSAEISAATGQLLADQVKPADFIATILKSPEFLARAAQLDPNTGAPLTPGAAPSTAPITTPAAAVAQPMNVVPVNGGYSSPSRLIATGAAPAPPGVTFAAAGPGGLLSTVPSSWWPWILAGAFVASYWIFPPARAGARTHLVYAPPRRPRRGQR